MKKLICDWCGEEFFENDEETEIRKLIPKIAVISCHDCYRKIKNYYKEDIGTI